MNMPGEPSRRLPLQLQAAVSHSMGMLGLSSGPGEEQRVLL